MQNEMAENAPLIYNKQDMQACMEAQKQLSSPAHCAWCTASFHQVMSSDVLRHQGMKTGRTLRLDIDTLHDSNPSQRMHTVPCALRHHDASASHLHHAQLMLS